MRDDHSNTVRTVHGFLSDDPQTCSNHIISSRIPTPVMVCCHPDHTLVYNARFSTSRHPARSRTTTASAHQSPSHWPLPARRHGEPLPQRPKEDERPAGSASSRILCKNHGAFDPATRTAMPAPTGSSSLVLCSTTVKRDPKSPPRHPPTAGQKTTVFHQHIRSYNAPSTLYHSLVIERGASHTSSRRSIATASRGKDAL
jgi:hypothetical protein